MFFDTSFHNNCNEKRKLSLAMYSEGQPFGKQKYSIREHYPLGKWWKNHTLPQYGEQRAKWHILGDYLKSSEAISFKNMALTDERQQSLSKGMKLQSFS